MHIDAYVDDLVLPLEEFFRTDPKFQNLFARFEMIKKAIEIRSSFSSVLAADLNKKEENINIALTWIILEVVDSPWRDRKDVVKEIELRSEQCITV